MDRTDFDSGELDTRTAAANWLAGRDPGTAGLWLSYGTTEDGRKYTRDYAQGCKRNARARLVKRAGEACVGSGVRSPFALVRDPGARAGHDTIRTIQLGIHCAFAAPRDLSILYLCRLRAADRGCAPAFGAARLFDAPIAA